MYLIICNWDCGILLLSSLAWSLQFSEFCFCKLFIINHSWSLQVLGKCSINTFKLLHDWAKIESLTSKATSNILNQVFYTGSFPALNADSIQISSFQYCKRKALLLVHLKGKTKLNAKSEFKSRSWAGVKPTLLTLSWPSLTNFSHLPSQTLTLADIFECMLLSVFASFPRQCKFQGSRVLYTWVGPGSK